MMARSSLINPIVARFLLPDELYALQASVLLRLDSRMPTRTKASRERMNAYETEQARQIAAWKSQPPNPLSELWNLIALQPAKIVAKLIPDSLIRRAIELSYNASETLAGRESIMREAGVKHLNELRRRPLEECDRLAKQVGMTAQALATAEGAATGAGGALTTLIDIPLLFILGLRTILRISYCYGFPVEQPKDRYFNLGVFTAATSGSLATRLERLDQLRDLENLLIEEIQVELITQELLSFLFQLEVFEEVPGVGVASGALLNLAFMRRVDLTARRVFQERWLVENGKTQEIRPADVPARHLAPGWSGLLGRAAYSGCYHLGFGAALPVFTVASLLRPSGQALPGPSRADAEGNGRPRAAVRSSARRNIRSLPAPA
jgi:hypothetical protein